MQDGQYISEFRQRRKLNRLVDYLTVGLLLAVSLLSGIAWGAFHTAGPKLFLFLFCSAVSFILFLLESRSFLNREGFWSLAASLLVMHTGAWFTILKVMGFVPRGFWWKVIFAVLFLVEYKLLQRARNAVLRR